MNEQPDLFKLPRTDIADVGEGLKDTKDIPKNKPNIVLGDTDYKESEKYKDLGGQNEKAS